MKSYSVLIGLLNHRKYCDSPSVSKTAALNKLLRRMHSPVFLFIYNWILFIPISVSACMSWTNNIDCFFLPLLLLSGSWYTDFYLHNNILECVLFFSFLLKDKYIGIRLLTCCIVASVNMSYWTKYTNLNNYLHSSTRWCILQQFYGKLNRRIHQIKYIFIHGKRYDSSHTFMRISFTFYFLCQHNFSDTTNDNDVVFFLYKCKQIIRFIENEITATIYRHYFWNVRKCPEYFIIYNPFYKYNCN